MGGVQALGHATRRPFPLFGSTASVMTGGTWVITAASFACTRDGREEACRRTRNASGRKMCGLQTRRALRLGWPYPGVEDLIINHLFDELVTLRTCRLSPNHGFSGRKITSSLMLNSLPCITTSICGRRPFRTLRAPPFTVHGPYPFTIPAPSADANMVSTFRHVVSLNVEGGPRFDERTSLTPLRRLYQFLGRST